MTELEQIVATFESVSLHCTTVRATECGSPNLPTTAMSVVMVKGLIQNFVFDVLGQLIGFDYLDHGYSPIDRRHTALRSCAILRSFRRYD